MRSLIFPCLLAVTACQAAHNERTTSMPAAPTSANGARDSRTLTIDLLALDLETCGRCTGTDANLEAAIATVANVLRDADVEVEVRKTIVTSAAQAEALRFESSPTIRINGRDLALELRESNCGDCGDLCGCDGQVDCRVWVWQGREHTEAPKALVIDAILRAYGQAWDPATQASRPFRLPKNLRNFFEAKAQRTKHAQGEDCCDRTACCDGSEREACCGASSGAEACGCRG